MAAKKKRNAGSAERSPEADYTYLKPNIHPCSDVSDIAVTNHEAARWDRLPADAQQRCCAAVTRLILFKGSHRDVVSRTHVIDALKRINADYGGFAGSSLKAAQSKLFNTFGMHLIPGNLIPGAAEKAEAQKYYVVSALRSPQLRGILSEHDCDAPYRGAQFIVLMAIWSSPGRKIDLESLIKRLRKVDSSIPDTELLNASKHKRRRKDSSLTHSRKADGDSESESDDGENVTDGPSDRNLQRQKTSAGELNIEKLVSRMMKESYIAKYDTSKDGIIGDNVTLYTFGTRFYLEVGIRALVQAYFDARGIPMDPSVARDIENEESRLKGRLEENIQDNA